MVQKAKDWRHLSTIGFQDKGIILSLSKEGECKQETKHEIPN